MLTVVQQLTKEGKLVNSRNLVNHVDFFGYRISVTVPLACLFMAGWTREVYSIFHT